MTEYINVQMYALINEHVHSARDREILRRKLLDGIHFEPLAEEFDMSVSQVKRIVKREREKLFLFLDSYNKMTRK